MYRSGLFKLVALISLSLATHAANAQIVIGPVAAQEVPVFGAPLLIALGGFLTLLAYKFGLLSSNKNRVLGALLAIGVCGGIGGLQFVSDVEAGTVSGQHFMTNTSDTSYPIDAGVTNVYTNNSGITLEVKSIGAHSCPATCTVGLRIAASGSCQIDCD